MKRSYFLPGVFWDGMPGQGLCESGARHEIGASGGTLFVSELFSHENRGDIERAVRMAAGFRKIGLLSDCRPCCPGSVPQSFYDLRLGQVAGYVKRMHLHSAVSVVEPALVFPEDPKRVNSLRDYLVLASGLYRRLKALGCRFDGRGFPVIPKACYVRKAPGYMVDWENRYSKYIGTPSETAICFFRDDARIYRRLCALERDLPEYRKFAAVVEPDLTVTRDMEPQWQDMTMLLNRLSIAFLAYNRVPIIANSRCGGQGSLDNFETHPNDVVWASSTLGCMNLASPEDLSYLSKMLTLRPSAVMLYGKTDRLMVEQLNRMGILWCTYPDFHSLCKVRDRFAAVA